MRKRLRFSVLCLASVSLALLGPANSVHTRSNTAIVAPADEMIVKRAYMVLSMLNRVNRYETVYSSTHSRLEARRASFVSFQFRPLRTGAISEILNQRFYNLVTPRSGEVMNVMRSTHHLN